MPERSKEEKERLTRILLGTEEEWIKRNKVFEEEVDKDRDCDYTCPCGAELYYTKDGNLICKSCGEKISEEAFLISDLHKGIYRFT